MLIALFLVVTMAMPSDTRDDLFSKRLLFSPAGEPLVPVGLMQGQRRVVLESATGLLVRVKDDGPELEWPAGVPLVVERQRGRAATRARSLVLLELLEGAARGTRRDVQARLAERGLTTELLDVGGVYGVQGTVVDNRATLVITARARDAAAQDRMLTAMGLRPTPLEWLDKPPRTSVRVVVPPADAALPHIDAAAFVRVRAVPGEGGTESTIRVRNVEHSVGYAEHGFADRTFRREIIVVGDKDGALAVVNLVDQDTLVAGVLPSEMFASAPLEALKAQAVTARGELFAKVGRRHYADPFLVCSEQHCQVYKGVTAEDPRTNAAAAATRGELALKDGAVVDSVYSACCGGHTEDASVVWERPPSSALVGRVDASVPPPPGPSVDGSAVFGRADHGPGAAVPIDLSTDGAVAELLTSPRSATYCGKSSFNQKGDAYRWTRHFTAADLDAAFADLGVGHVRKLVVEERGGGGRLRSLRIEGDAATAHVLRELPVRKRLGNLRSGLFLIDEERDADGALVGVTLRGAGFGHGSGMCQQGAIGMAEAGLDYRAILAHYYGGAVVKHVF